MLFQSLKAFSSQSNKEKNFSSSSNKELQKQEIVVNDGKIELVSIVNK